MVNAEKIKEDVLYFLKNRGPSIPVNVATQIKSTILFTSAFLSELVSEKRIKMSNMRVGSSPVYFLSGQEAELETFSTHLKSKEKEAFNLLKERRFLIDSKTEPAIRVALRELKDFAFPFKSNEELVWRYFLVPESEYNIKEEKQTRSEIKEPIKELIEVAKEPIQEEKLLEVEKPEKQKEKKERKKYTKKAKPQQKERFFSQIKEFLTAKSMELKDIESFTKNEIVLRITENGGEKILVAFNKRKITDNDLIRAHKKASNPSLPYIVLGINEPAKKTSDLIKAMQNLSSIHGLK